MAPTVTSTPSKVALPNQAANAEARRQSIVKKREAIGYNHELIPKLALSTAPPAEFVELSDDYTMKRLLASAPYSINQNYTSSLRLFDVVNRMEDYDDFFIPASMTGVQAPTLTKDSIWMSDDHFAEQRLSGANPMIIQKLERDDPRAEVLGDLDLSFHVSSELDKGNIYICDYTGTDPSYRGPCMVTGGSSKSGKPKWLPKPMAWFHWEEDRSNRNTGGKLVPVAIQLDPSTDCVDYRRKFSRVHTPKEENSMDWLFAKICVQVADSLHHEMSSHLARCHFTMEPIAIATHRTLADEHPIALLINTHMRFHIANDSVAAYTLIANSDAGNVKDLMPGTLRESMALLTESYEKWDLLGTNFNNDIVARNMSDDDRLPHYPYRDDGRLIYEIIEEWVDSYINLFYKSDGDVANDIELQDFARECVDSKAGRVKGMPQQISTRSMLSDILCSIIFVCGPGHGCINFAQYEYMAFAPNMPLALYGNYDLLCEQEEPITEQQLISEILPDAEHAERQLGIVFNLTAYKYDQFGNYDKTFMDWFGTSYVEHMKDVPGLEAAYSSFQERLEVAEQEIKKRNAHRPTAYPYMQPSEMMNSISI